MPLQTAKPASRFDAFLERIGTLTAENILSDETFAEIFVQENEVYRQQLINRLRGRAKELHIPMENFREMLAAHKAFCKKREREQNEMRRRQIGNDQAWYRGGIDENEFCKEFLRVRPIRNINGLFYDEDGAVPAEMLEQEIHRIIAPYVSRKIAPAVKGLMDALRIAAYAPAQAPDPKHIHVLNGTLGVDGVFLPVRQFCLNRLNVTYEAERPKPERWLGFLNDLLCPDDILTLQEYLGYCLIPSTKAQAMLFLIGSGGEGKSRIGVVMNEIFQNSMVSGCLQDLENNRFSLAALENKLLFLDDDMSVKATEDGRNLKKIVTAESPILIERKCVQPYEAQLYSRLLAFGNVPLRALFDHSDGMFCRQIILRVKPKPEGRADDPFLAEKLLAEKDAVFNWCFEGLQRLVKNRFRFTVSERAKKNLEEARQENCNLIRFLADNGFVTLGDPQASITCENLMLCYEYWCRINSELPLKRNTAILYLKTNAEKYGIRYSYNILNDRHRRVRGFEGIRQMIRFGSTDV